MFNKKLIFHSEHHLNECNELILGIFMSFVSWKAITDYIEQQFEQYFRDESGLNRKNIQDNRVHCCLYFIPPFGHG